MQEWKIVLFRFYFSNALINEKCAREANFIVCQRKKVRKIKWNTTLCNKSKMDWNVRKTNHRWFLCTQNHLISERAHHPTWKCGQKKKTSLSYRIFIDSFLFNLAIARVREYLICSILSRWSVYSVCIFSIYWVIFFFFCQVSSLLFTILYFESCFLTSSTNFYLPFVVLFRVRVFAPRPM